MKILILSLILSGCAIQNANKSCLPKVTMLKEKFIPSQNITNTYILIYLNCNI